MPFTALFLPVFGLANLLICLPPVSDETNSVHLYMTMNRLTIIFIEKTPKVLI